MRIAVAQSRPLKGDIAGNIAGHLVLIDLALSAGSRIIIFPELSITGYEPALASELATGANDPRLAVFQEISDKQGMVIGVGLPVKTATAPQIGMVIFQPHLPRLTYTKQYLHEDELPFFVAGSQQVYLCAGGLKMAPAICYELSVPAHAANVAACQTQVYLVSVAKTASGMEKAAQTLSATARNHNMTVLLSNCLGRNDDFIGAGNAAVWNNRGELLLQLDDAHEGVLVYDMDTQEAKAFSV